MTPSRRCALREACGAALTALALGLLAGCGVPIVTGLDTQTPRPDVPSGQHDIAMSQCNPACGECQSCVGERCVAADDGVSCLNGTCEKGMCCQGCWDGTTCQDGHDVMACGAQGVACATCSDNMTACIAGSCSPPCAWNSVVLGSNFGCGIRPDSTLWCWGSNDSGQLGTGDATNYLSPIQVNGSTRWEQLAAGAAHACSLLTDSTIWCWGSNDHGQLGQADTMDRPSPNRVSDTRGWIGVTAGKLHTCAVLGDGTLWCWGANASSQLGTGDVMDRSSATMIGTDNDWTQVSAGYSHTCAIKSNGTLWCWGANSGGALGMGDATASVVAAPKQVGTDTDWSQVAAGGIHTCGLRGAALYCWGNNQRGQLGLGDRMDRTSPTQVGDGFKALSVGSLFTCAIDSMAGLECWGENGAGQLGIGMIGPSNGVAMPSAVGTDTDWKAITSGLVNNCGIRLDGTLYCWGDNSSGQIGVGTTDPGLNPAAVCVSDTPVSGGMTDGGTPDASGPTDGGPVALDLVMVTTDMQAPGCPSPVDCTDPRCNGAGCAANGKVCSGGACTCPGGQTKETSCGDGKDNDCDGKIDCADSDCDRKQCGSSPTSRCCGGRCVDTTTNNANCQGCGLACASGQTCVRLTDSDGTRGICTCTINSQCPKNPSQICRMGQPDNENGGCACDVVNHGNAGCDTGQHCVDVPGANFCTY